MTSTASTALPSDPDHNSPAKPGASHTDDTFAARHIGPGEEDIAEMLAAIGVDSLDALADATVPESIRLREALGLPDALSEDEALARIQKIAGRNEVFRSFIGMGYHGTITPPVIQRNILENPGWYTQYTPYQAEIAQGRLEALLIFQTMIADLTGLPVANASLLDEATAAAEAMAMCIGAHRGKRTTFFVAGDCHPQTINVCRTRAESMRLKLVVGGVDDIDTSDDDLAGVLVQYPNTFGEVHDYAALAEKVHEAGALFVVAADPLALTLLTPPGEFGADIAVGSTQRFGVPMGGGGPHAAYMATTEKHVRKMPGRIVGISKDSQGNPAYRLAIQTREQHIKRERATSNICTAQVLLAIMAGMYAVWHGPEGLKRIAGKVHAKTRALASALGELGLNVGDHPFFDTLTIPFQTRQDAQAVLSAAANRRCNLRDFGDHRVGIALDETTSEEDLKQLVAAFADALNAATKPDIAAHLADAPCRPQSLPRSSAFLTHESFNRYHAEHEMLRYLHRLQSKDLSLTAAMIPLGSCTMKLNATSLMMPLSWPQVAHMHPYAPPAQAAGYGQLAADLEDWLAKITGFAATSLQPNAGSQGEYAGLLAIRGYHESRGEADRDVCLIPVSAHGTNPASAIIAGMRVVSVDCDSRGNIDVEDLEAKAKEHAAKLAALMVTYPSTHGVFEATIRDVCRIVHEHGGQVYMDGANMNALVGLCRVVDIGADVCHFNLHKTFAIPHGGGGPGMGPIAVAEHLKDFLPGDPLAAPDDRPGYVGPVAAAAWGSASILAISWMYIAMMGEAGLRKATQVAILNANYLAHRLHDHYDVLYTGETGRVAHEFILDTRHFHVSAAIDVDDIAKRLMDYGFHAPTMSWPVAGTLMIEPTESESKYELDRFAEAMIGIRAEIRRIEQADADIEDNVLKHAPHTAAMVSANVWPHPYAREEAAYPAPGLRQYKFWPAVGRIDNPYGDRNLVCACS